MRTHAIGSTLLQPKNPSTVKGALQRFAYIDALRGIAVLLVLLHHVPHAWHDVRDYLTEALGANAGAVAFKLYDLIVNFSAHGVQLFYIVSAFTLFHSLSARNESRPIAKFFIRRFFRIAPMFYFYIGVVAFAYYFLHITLFQHSELNARSVLSLITFTNGIEPTLINFIKGGWSIAVEMTFYLFVPFLFLAIKNFRTSFISTIGVFTCVIFLLNFLLSKGGDTDIDLWRTFVFTSFPSQLPVFLLGVTVYFLLKTQDKNRKAHLYIFYTCFTLLCLLIVYHFLSQSYFLEVPFLNAVRVEFRIFLLSILLVHLVFLLAHFPFRALVNKFTILVGQLSFSVYLWHLGVIDIMNHYGFMASIDQPGYNPIIIVCIKYTIVLGMTVFLSFITFHLIEKRGILMGKALVEKI